MGRIVVPVHIRNPLEAGKEMLCDALVDTGAGSTGALPNPDLLVSMYVRKEAVLSSQIGPR